MGPQDLCMRLYDCGKASHENSKTAVLAKNHHFSGALMASTRWHGFARREARKLQLLDTNEVSSRMC